MSLISDVSRFLRLQICAKVLICLTLILWTKIMTYVLIDWYLYMCGVMQNWLVANQNKVSYLYLSIVKYGVDSSWVLKYWIVNHYTKLLPNMAWRFTMHVTLCSTTHFCNLYKLVSIFKPDNKDWNHYIYIPGTPCDLLAIAYYKPFTPSP